MTDNTTIDNLSITHGLDIRQEQGKRQVYKSASTNESKREK
jgi:hypothetical protein